MLSNNKNAAAFLRREHAVGNQAIERVPHDQHQSIGHGCGRSRQQYHLASAWTQLTRSRDQELPPLRIGAAAAVDCEMRHVDALWCQFPRQRRQSLRFKNSLDQTRI